jgi:signal transduction histidine kinase
MDTGADEDQLRRLLRAGRALVSERDVESVLEQILEGAREVTRARYAALGVLDETRTQLERFLTRGVDAATHRAIGDLPSGRGVLGVLIEEPTPLRLPDVSRHPYSYGFPPNHPEMRSFLGVPLLIEGSPWGNLYLAEKEYGQEFTELDEEAAVVLAQWAAIAIENARLYEGSERRREALEHAVRSLEAARSITDAISAESSLERILELVVKRGRALIKARAVVILLREGADLVVAATAGRVAAARSQRIPISESSSGLVLERDRPERFSDVRRLKVAPKEMGIHDARSALLVPMRHRGEGLGVLAAFDRGAGQEAFTAEDEEVLRSFAAAAANAVAISRSVRAERLHSALAAAETERGRWARELHDQTLQSLGGLRVMLSSALARGDAARKESAIHQAVEDIEIEIDNLRGIISDLRPSLLDDLGLVAAVEALLDRRRDGGLKVAGELTLPEGWLAGARGRDLETIAYRVVQEALTNVVKHANADSARVLIECSDGVISIEVEDDGVGFDNDQATDGFGLLGIRERVSLVGGSFEVESSGRGTVVRACMPAAEVRGLTEDHAGPEAQILTG